MQTPLFHSEQPFEIVSDFTPAGDQPAAIERLTANIEAGVREQVLLGVTGSGKTFTMAQVVARVQRPTLVMAPNKTLAAQLFGEFRQLFPHNAVEYFVSYYDYYQPEAYIPASDTYIEKDSSINDAIDKMRHSATRSLLTRRDVLIVASVSCIYGLGSPDEYKNMHLFLRTGEEYPMEEVLRRLVFMLYERNDYSFHRGTFRVRGDVIDIFPAHEEEHAVRVEFFGDTIDAIAIIDPLRGVVVQDVDEMAVFPGSHHVTSQENLKTAMRSIQEELQVRLAELQAENRLVEAQRLEQRTLFDLEMITELGYCNGIENYSRHLTGKPHRGAAAQPARLFSRRLSPDHRRVAHRGAADRRHVQRRPLAQADPGQLRFSPALGPGQPAAALRRIRSSASARWSMFRPRPAPMN